MQSKGMKDPEAYQRKLKKQQEMEKKAELAANSSQGDGLKVSDVREVSFGLKYNQNWQKLGQIIEVWNF